MFSMPSHSLIEIWCIIEIAQPEWEFTCHILAVSMWKSMNVAVTHCQQAERYLFSSLIHFWSTFYEYDFEVSFFSVGFLWQNGLPHLRILILLWKPFFLHRFHLHRQSKWYFISLSLFSKGKIIAHAQPKYLYWSWWNNGLMWKTSPNGTHTHTQKEIAKKKIIRITLSDWDWKYIKCGSRWLAHFARFHFFYDVFASNRPVWIHMKRKIKSQPFDWTKNWETNALRIARTHCAYLFGLSSVHVCTIWIVSYFFSLFTFLSVWQCISVGRKSEKHNSIPQNATLPLFPQKSVKYATHWMEQQCLFHFTPFRRNTVMKVNIDKIFNDNHFHKQTPNDGKNNKQQSRKRKREEKKRSRRWRWRQWTWTPAHRRLIYSWCIVLLNMLNIMAHLVWKAWNLFSMRILMLGQVSGLPSAKHPMNLDENDLSIWLCDVCRSDHFPSIGAWASTTENEFKVNNRLMPTLACVFGWWRGKTDAAVLHDWTLTFWLVAKFKQHF